MSLQTQLDKLLPAPDQADDTRQDHLRILQLDLETYPARTWQWSLFDRYTPTERVISEGGMLCWAAKWYGEPDTMTGAYWTDGRQGMAERLWPLLTEADAVVTYNGDRFDLKHIRTAVELDSGLGPAAPYVSVDLYRTMKRFAMLSRKLGYVTERMSIGYKLQHEGFQLWVDAMPAELGGNGCPDAQQRMLDYNVQDVAGTLEPLYDAMLPWIKGHPHVGLYADDGRQRCQRCGATGLDPAGYAFTPLGRFRRYRCRRCRSWHRGRTRVAGVDVRGIG